MKVLWGLRPMGILDGPVRLPLLITCGPVWNTYGSLAEKWSSYYLVPPQKMQLDHGSGISLKPQGMVSAHLNEAIRGTSSLF